MATEAHGMAHYLGLFIFYTLLVVGVIYGLYWFARKNPGLLQMGKKSAESKDQLAIEQVLALEPRKNLYVIKAGDERFLVATSAESTQFLAKLNASDAPVAAGGNAQNPSDVLMAQAQMQAQAASPMNLQMTEAPESAPAADDIPEKTWTGRFMQSLRWIVAARFKSV